MDREFPRYLLVAIALYAFSFLLMLGFVILPVLQAGGAAYAEFYFYLLLTLLPLVLIILYIKTEFAAMHGIAFRLGIVVSSLVLSLIFLFVFSPLIV